LQRKVNKTGRSLEFEKQLEIAIDHGYFRTCQFSQFSQPLQILLTLGRIEETSLINLPSLYKEGKWQVQLT